MTRTLSALGLAAAVMVAALAPAPAAAQPKSAPPKATQPKGTGGKTADPRKRDAEPWVTPSGADVKYLDNAPWKVTVTVDRPDATYYVGDEVTIKVTSENAGFLYVFAVDATGKIVCLFPNQFVSDNAILPNAEVSIPAPANPAFRIKADTAGKELIKAFVSKERIQEIDMKTFTRGPVTPVDRKKFLRFAVEAMGGDPNTVPNVPEGTTTTTVPPPGTDPNAPPTGVTVTPPGGQGKPEVVIQKEKIQKQKPDTFVKKKKEWSCGEVVVTVLVKTTQFQKPPTPPGGQTPPPPPPGPQTPKPPQGTPKP